MVKRPFSFENKELYYGAGQPMGMLSSWAVFALTHHFIVEWIHWKETGKFTFRDYCVLGDDIVIWNENNALGYQALMQDIGVNINLAKSKIGTSHNPHCEFAKRLFRKGEEISPIPWEVLVQASESWVMVPNLMRVMGIRSLDTHLRPGYTLGSFGHNGRKNLELTLTYPFAKNKCSTNEVNPWELYTPEEIQKEYNKQRIKSLDDSKLSVFKMLDKQKSIEQYIKDSPNSRCIPTKE